MLSLIEASKLLPTNGQRSILQIFATTYDPLEMLPIRSEPYGIMRWSVVDGKSEAAGRAINGTFSETNITSTPYSANSAILGKTFSIDTYIVSTNPGAVAAEKRGQVEGYAYTVTKDMFEGAGGNTLRGIRDWLQNEFTSSDITMGSTSGGVLITMAKMDELVNAVNVIPGKTKIYMSQAPYNLLNTLSRTNGAGQQNIQWMPNEFGIQIPTYGGIPIVVLKDAKGNNILSNVETDSANTGGTACSVYIVTFDEDNFTGFSPENGAVKVQEFQTQIEKITASLQVIAGVAPRHARACARLNNVKNAVA